MRFVSGLSVRLISFVLFVLLVGICSAFAAEEAQPAKVVASAALGGDGGSSGGNGGPLPDLFTGSMSYSVPIEVPPGRNGMDPGLSLTYNSRGGNSWVGVGWDLEVGAIERSTKKGVDYGKDDYVLRRSGSLSDLVQSLPPAYPGDKSEYRLKFENDFMKIQKMAQADFPGYYFVATNKSGIRFFFGQTGNACVYASSDVFKWALNRIEDLNGNFITFTYSSESGQIYLNHIDYNGNTIQFYLEDREDKPLMFTTNHPVTTAKRLKTIDIFAQGLRQRRYELSYDIDEGTLGSQYSAKTGRSLLGSITNYGKDDVSLPPIKFKYSNNDNFESTQWEAAPYPALDQYEDHAESVVTGDFNGDGRLDVAHTRDKWHEWHMSLSTGQNPFSTQSWWTTPDEALSILEDGNERVIAGDFDGDGKTDLARTRTKWPGWSVLLSTGTGFSPPIVWPTGGWAADALDDGREQVVSGDFNGDGKTDIAHTRNKWGFWRVSLSNGSGFSTKDWSTTPFNAAEELKDGNERILVGDFNGDGKTDIAHTRSKWDGWNVSLSTGSDSFITESWKTSPYWAAEYLDDHEEFVVAGDFNGDGKTDIARARSGWNSWLVSLSTGSGFETEDWSTTPFPAIYDLSDGHETIITGDFNGDGKTDIARTRSGWSYWLVSLSTGHGFLSTQMMMTTPYSAADNLKDGMETVIAGDFAGDGLTHIAHARTKWGFWRVSGNTVRKSQIPDMLVSIDNGKGGVTNIDYVPSTTTENNKIPFSVQVVDSITTVNGNVESKTNFKYSHGYYNIADHEFRGFNRVTVIGPAGSNGGQTITETWFHQGNETGVVDEGSSADSLDSFAKESPGYMKGKPYRTRVSGTYDGQQFTTFSEEETTYKAQVTSPNYFTPILEMNSYSCGGGVTGHCNGNANSRHVKTEYTFDNYGNPVQEDQYGDVSDPTDDRTIVRTYVNDANQWIVGLLSSETVYPGIGTANPLVSSTSYDYFGETDCSTYQAITTTKGRLAKVKKKVHGWD